MARVGHRLQERGKAEIMIVTRGDLGALAILHDSAWRLQSPKGKVVSLVGAGDSLIGAFVLAMARGKPLLEACRLGVAAASAAVEAPGSELASRKDTLRIARRTKLWEVGLDLSHSIVMVRAWHDHPSEFRWANTQLRRKQTHGSSCQARG